jgi:hypothetical protein
MKQKMGFYLLTYQCERRLANLVVVSAASLTEARLRFAPGVGDAILDQVLPLEPEIGAARRTCAGVWGPWPLAVEMPRSSNPAAMPRILVMPAAVSSSIIGSKSAALPLARAESRL